MDHYINSGMMQPNSYWESVKKYSIKIFDSLPIILTSDNVARSLTCAMTCEPTEYTKGGMKVTILENITLIIAPDDDVNYRFFKELSSIALKNDETGREAFEIRRKLDFTAQFDYSQYAKVYAHGMTLKCVETLQNVEDKDSEILVHFDSPNTDWTFE